MAQAADPGVPDVVMPYTIGPTWQRGEDGRFVLPEYTLGWQCLAWSSMYLQHYVGRAWQYTPEQARLTLWWYAMDPVTNRFRWRDGVLQRLKGWGKDPVKSTWAAFEFVGPCRFGGIADEGNPWGVPAGQPLGVQHPAAWVQIAAVSQDQTRNTMTLFPSIFTRRAIQEYRIDLGKEIIYADKGRARIEAVTSSPRALEGGRPSATFMGETHHWLESNSGHEMAAVIERNTTKSADGQARTMADTNAYEPGEDSVAERTREAYEATEAGRAADVGLFYDSLEAPPEALLTEAWIEPTLLAVRGDSTWLDISRIKASILDVRNPPSRSRRFWFNQIVATEDAFLAVYEWDACPHEGIALEDGDQVVCFFDGSKSDDATGLVACRLSDGHVQTLGVWQRPAGWPEGRPWRVPREEVDGVVEQTFARFRPLAFFADPGAGQDDADGERYWDGYIDAWAQRYGKRLKLKAVVTGHAQHAVMWDMRERRRQQAFTEAVDRFYRDVLERQLTHDGSRELRRHIGNARRRTNAWGYTIGKEHRESARKVDLAVCAVGARMLRRMVMNSPAWAKRSTARGKGRVVVLR
ncbi:phage terminase family protein [Streptomyces sp. STCH 565 A]|uniref:phage terminase family protein n=1 Tax=Streptomyces sp. STCH 565 A TaxID=2950532 RepID=UPI002075BBCF|nr:phage terminase family protein [Streptomyces sp. STCH 565 A]MCM8548896.1 phage terminase family protein [Streptomyces sp. STCH 565 A]